MNKRILTVLAAAVLVTGAARADNHWIGAPGTTGDWFTATSWSGGNYPQAGDDVVITNIGAAGKVLLTNSTPLLSSLTISNTATLVFSNWNTTVNATNVTIGANGSMTLPVKFANNVMSNNVCIVCTNFTLNTGGSINANYLGYAGGVAAGVGQGPGGGFYADSRGGGGGYGGQGGSETRQTTSPFYLSYCGTGGVSYGSAALPLQPGSGGGGKNDAIGGAGGGAVSISASNVTLNGNILANGQDNPSAAGSGGGSGGGVYINCVSLGGNGQILANGGAGTVNNGAPGGGGRISVNYTSLIGTPVITLSASNGPGQSLVSDYPNWGPLLPGMGTIYLSQTNLLGTTISNISGVVMSPGSYTLPSLIVTNGVTVGFTNLTVTGDLTIAANSALLAQGNPGLTVNGNVRLNGGQLVVQQSTNVTIGGTVWLTNGAAMHVFGAVTNATTSNTTVNIAGDVQINSLNSWIYPVSHPFNGGSVTFYVNNLNISVTNAGFCADYRGWSGGLWTGNNTGKGYGPGGGGIAGSRGNGAGYGGQGGASYSGGWGSTGLIYGTMYTPVYPGSGGAEADNQGDYPPVCPLESGPGGGLIRIHATGNAVVNGTLTANGGPDGNRVYGGAGSGGGILLFANSFSGGSGAQLLANGGNIIVAGNASGPGGGGRIAVGIGFSTAQQQQLLSGNTSSITLSSPTWGAFAGSISVAPGTNGVAYAGNTQYAPGTGTVVFIQTGMAPSIANLDATNVTGTSACFNGSLISTGTAPITAVSVYWGYADGLAPTSGLWQNTNFVAGSSATWTNGATVTYPVSGLTFSPTTNYYYRYYATNAVGAGWSATSKMVVATPPAITNLDATNVTATSACFNGSLISTGTAPITAVSVYWGYADGLNPTSGLWQYTNSVAGISATWTNGASLTYLATNLAFSPTTNYYYRYWASNSVGAGWSATSKQVSLFGVSVAATDSSATRNPTNVTDTGILTIQRDASATNDPVTVYYAWQGTAGLGTDYTVSPAGTSVTLPAGVASTNITITPLWGYGARTVWLTLQPGPYYYNSPSSNYVTIADYAYTPGANVTTNSGNWANAAIWSLGRRPLYGDDVTVNTNVMLSGSSDYLSSFTLTNATLTFSNWNTTLNATNVTIQSNAVIALPGAFPISGASNNVCIVCTNLALNAGGSINVNYCGWGGVKGTDSSVTTGQGPGRGFLEGSFSSGGGGYGGVGEWGFTYALYPAGTNGVTYGSAALPLAPGSSGSAYHSTAYVAAGGGAVSIIANAVTLNGSILANGQTSTTDGGNGGSGSGGGVYINTQVLGGSGQIQANGGNLAVGNPTPNGGGAGGGGRISLNYATLSGSPALTISATNGADFVPNVFYPWSAYASGAGTVYLSQTNLLGYSGSQVSGIVIAPGFASLTLPDLTVANGAMRVFTNGFNLNVPHNLTISNSTLIVQGNPGLTVGNDVMINGGQLVVQYSTNLAIGGSLTLTNGGQLHVCGATTNATTPQTIVQIGGNVSIASNCWIYPVSDYTNGGSVTFNVGGGLTVAQAGASAGICADNRGYGAPYGPQLNTYTNGSGPGKGITANNVTGGGGYGGVGGTAQNGGGWGGRGGTNYGSAYTPIFPGSSGGNYRPWWCVGLGGGLIYFNVTGSVQMNGTLSACGASMGDSGIGAGSGGGILVFCRQFSGASGAQINAKGGNGSSTTVSGSGPGGGGRIAVAVGFNAAQQQSLLAGNLSVVKSSNATWSAFGGSLSAAAGINGPSTNYTGFAQYAPGAGTVLFLTPPSGGSLIFLK